MAFPHKPIMRMDAPNLVNFPKPSMAKGHIPAQIKEFANPNNTTNQILQSACKPANLTGPDANKMPIVNIRPNKVHIRSAVT